MSNLLGMEEFEIDTAGGKKTYVLSKFPATVGREIIVKYPTANAPKIGEYAVSEETMLTLMKHVGVNVAEGGVLALNTRALVDNHVPDAETLLKLEVAMFRYNYSFFGNGKGLSFLEEFIAKLPQLISKTLTILSDQSSDQGKPPSTS